MLYVGVQFADHNLTKLNERLLLFRHVYDTPNILQMINSAAEVEQDSLVEIVMSGSEFPYPTLHLYNLNMIIFVEIYNIQQLILILTITDE